MRIFLSAMLIPGLMFFGCVALEEKVLVLEEQNAELEQRIDQQQEGLSRIESRLDSITRTENVKDQEFRGRLAGFNEKINQIRDEIKRLRGGFEEKEHAMKQRLENAKKVESQQGSRMDRVEEITFDNKDRLSRIEQYLNLEGSRTTVTKPETAPKPEPVSKPVPVVKAEPTEKSAYESAKAAFDKGDYDEARQEFQSFLKTYPKSENADNAQFWIGETYYREKWYEYAILEYQKVIESYPKGNKVQASLLKQGLAFFNLGQKNNARLILRELISKYPKSNEANIAKQKLKEFK